MRARFFVPGTVVFMRTDVSVLAAQRAVKVVCAAAAAHLHEDFEGCFLLLKEALEVSPVADLIDAALLATAELFTSIASIRSLTTHQLCLILSFAVKDLTSDVLDHKALADVMNALCSYADGDLELFSLSCEKLSANLLALEPSIVILAGAIRWTARDNFLDPSLVASNLCLRIALCQNLTIST